MPQFRTPRSDSRPRRFIAKASKAFLILAAAFGVAHATADTVSIGGVGAVTPLVKRLAADFSRANRAIAVAVIDPPIGSTGGLRALAAGKLDIALSGRPLNPGETGVVHSWVRTPLVLATSDGRLESSALETYAAIFSGARRTWDDGRPVRLVLRGAFESETLTLRSLSPAMREAIDAALARREAPVADNDLQALDLLVKVKGSLGSTSFGLASSHPDGLRMLPIQGRMPSLEGLASGHYPWHRSFQLVLGENPTEPARKFLAYLRSDRGYDTARKLGYLPPEH